MLYDSIQDIFSRVSNRYDLMNDAMSFGTHRLWKRAWVANFHMRPEQRVLDVSTGTGDIALLLHRYFKALEPEIHLLDPNLDMLRVAQSRAIDRGWVNAPIVCAAAEAIPYENDTFDHVVCSFGVRNMSDRARALSEIHRVLRSGGWFEMLEFTPTNVPLARAYLDHVVPFMGATIGNDRAAYEYLRDSIHNFPNAHAIDAELASIGFGSITHRVCGVVASHKGQKD